MLRRKKKVKHYSVRLRHRINARLDNFVGYAFLYIIFGYVLAYGIFETGGFVWTTFKINIILVLLLVWVVDGFKVFIESFTRRSYRSSAEDLSKVTVIIACKDGEDVIEKTLKSLLKRFKPEQIIVASNGSTDHTVLISKHYNVRVLDIKEPLGKVRAINRALKLVATPYALLLDDDTLVGKAKVPTGLLDEGYDGVAFRVLVQKSNWVSQLQLYEYRKSTDLGKRYHNNKASVQNISGAIGLFTTQELRRQIKRHSGEFSGEDLQRTLLIHLTQDARGVVLTDSTVYTQPPTTIKTLFSQRVFGWFPGLYANFGNYVKILTRDQMPPALRFDAFYNVFLVMLLDILRLISLPILILYPWYFIVTYAVYCLFELVSYTRTRANDSLWVVLMYPLYGLFGFVTRACAFTTFIYRRLAVHMGKQRFLDDYRKVAIPYKIIAIILSLSLIISILSLKVFLNIRFF